MWCLAGTIILFQAGPWTFNFIPDPDLVNKALPDTHPIDDYLLSFRHNDLGMYQMPAGITLIINWGDGTAEETVTSPLPNGWGTPHL